MRKALIALILAGSLTAGRPVLLELWSFLGSALNGPSSDEGCGFDPSGRCTPAPQTDAGCGFDPSGCPKGS